MKRLAKLQDAFAHGDWERDLRIVDSVLQGTKQSAVADEHDLSLSQIQVICRRFHKTALRGDIRGDVICLPVRKHFSILCMRLELEYWTDMVDHLCMLFNVKVPARQPAPENVRLYKKDRNIEIFEALLLGTSSVTVAAIHRITTARVFYIWNGVIVRLQEIAISRGMPPAPSDGVDVVRNNKNYWLECLDVMKHPQRGITKRNEDVFTELPKGSETRNLRKSTGVDSPRLAHAGRC